MATFIGCRDVEGLKILVNLDNITKIANYDYEHVALHTIVPSEPILVKGRVDQFEHEIQAAMTERHGR